MSAAAAGRATLMRDDDPRARRERQIAYLQALHQRGLQRFREAAAQDAVELAGTVHRETDATLARDLERDAGHAPIRCGKGCSHCCSGPVEIWPQEAALLAAYVREAAIPIDAAKLERQSRHSVDSWREQPVSDQSCVFLQPDGACGVYAVRPNACRKLLVTSDPQYCDISRGEYERIERWFSWETEMVEVAALEVLGKVMLPLALSDALRDDLPSRQDG